MIQSIAGILAGAGVYLIISDLFRMPTLKTTRSIYTLIKSGTQKNRNIERWLQDFSRWLSGHISLNEYKRIQIESDIRTANLNITPEMFISNAIIKCTLVGMLAIPVLFIFPIISPLIITLAITIYFKETQGMQERIKEKRSKIEQGLPTLVFNIEKTLTHSRDVLSILESYKRNAGPVMQNELSITIADMRSGNYELALTRLEARVGSSMLSDVTRGLVSILRGDETGMYWTSLSLKLADNQRQLLKRKAMKVPGRIKRLSMVLLCMFMATYIVIIGIEVMSSLGAILG